MARKFVQSGAVLKFFDEARLTEASFTTHVDDAASTDLQACCHCSRKLTQFAHPPHEGTLANRSAPRTHQPPGPHRRGESLHVYVAHILAVQPILQSAINGGRQKDFAAPRVVSEARREIHALAGDGVG